MSDQVADRLNRPGGRPAPVVTPVNEGMWRAAAVDQLAVQRCLDCGAHRYPPGDGCYSTTAPSPAVFAGRLLLLSGVGRLRSGGGGRAEDFGEFSGSSAQRD